MNKLWRITTYEYLRHVLRRRFLFALLSMPAVVVIMALVILLLIRIETDTTPVGYVDHSGLLADPLPPPPPDPPGKPVPFIAFQTEEEAEAALKAEEIQAYYVLSADYLATSQAELVFLKEPGDPAQEQFETFLLVNLLRDQPEPVARRVVEGTHVTVQSADGQRKMAEDDFMAFLIPFVGGLVLVIAIFTSSGYLMQAVVGEKENRTVEILLTSVSPWQLMIGKVVGIIGVGLTQLLVWGAVGLLALFLGRDYFRLDWLQNTQFPLGPMMLTALIMAPAFVMIAALMAAVGATVTEAREGQQVAGLFTLPVMVPYWLTYQIMTNPNGPLAIGLSFFPLTAPVALSLRLGFAIIPRWQLLAIFVELVLAALGALWLAGYTFRLGMPRYGKRLTLREIITSFRRPA